MSDDISKQLAETKDFLKEEQKQRRQDIEVIAASCEADQRNILLISGAIWSWFATNTDKFYAEYKYIVLVPAGLTVLFFIRWVFNHYTIKNIARYTKKLETLFEVPDGYGWESYLSEGGSAADRSRDYRAIMTMFFFGVLLMANLLLAYLFWNSLLSNVKHLTSVHDG
jgi:hypothetical protein